MEYFSNYIKSYSYCMLYRTYKYEYRITIIEREFVYYRKNAIYDFSDRNIINCKYDAMFFNKMKLFRNKYK